MGCKNHIKYYWDCNVDHHREFYSFSKEERNIWTDFLIKRLNNSRKVLELGCGTGNVTEALVEGGYEVTALDISYEMIKEVEKRNGKSKVVVGDHLNTVQDKNFCVTAEKQC
ncbi:MAG: class I SAM-dependent methyltransferase [Archaeoglobaceae archaeon]